MSQADKNKILITGCGGMLGEAVYKQFKDKCRVFATDIDVNEPWLKYLDVSDLKAVLKQLDKIKPDKIIHLAALTDMEYCELNPAHAYDVNSHGVDNLAFYASKKDIPFVYISTAGIFDGRKNGYMEDDQPEPSSIYGKSKYLGELIARSVPKHIVLRAGWMMGGGPKKDKKFISKIVKQLRAGSKNLNVVDDKLGTPCYTYDLARSIEYLLNSKKYGLYHGACRGGDSRYGIARFLISTLGLKDKIKIKKVGSDHFKKDYFAPRPRSEKLLNLRLNKLNRGLTRDWKVCLKEYLEKFDWLSPNIKS